MNGLDYAILAVILISAAIGVWRGFFREAFSLAVWASAFWLAYIGAGMVEVYFAEWMSDKSLRLAAAFVVLFMAVHVVGFVLSRLLKTVISSVGLSGVDRVAGAGFGVARGVLVVAVIILLVHMTPLEQEVLWQQSYMVAIISDVTDWVQIHYPLGLVERLYQVAEYRL